MTYNPFALPPRTIKEFLGESTHSVASYPIIRDPNPLIRVEPSAPPLLHDLVDERYSPFTDISDGRSDSRSVQQPITDTAHGTGIVINTEDQKSGYGSSCILFIILLFVLFLGIGALVGYYYKKSESNVPNETDTQDRQNPKPTTIDNAQNQNPIPAPSAPINEKPS